MHRVIKAEDLYDFTPISDCEISPDGKNVIYSLQRVDKKTEKKYSNLWVVPTEGGPPQQFTYRNQTDAQPKWSPDGREVAFISNRDKEEQPQIYIIPFQGGEARALTDLKGDFENFEWSPDGKKILFTFRKKDKEEIEREEDEQKKKLGVVSRHITRVIYCEDNRGFLPRERLHIWVVDIQRGKTTQLTDSDVYDEIEPSWSPDGTRIVFCSNRTRDPDLDPDEIDIFVMPAQGGMFTKIETPSGPKSVPRFSPDGSFIAYCGHEEKLTPWKHRSLWIIPVTGEEARNLTGRHDFDVSANTINDVPGKLQEMPPVWSPDSKKIYFHVSHHGSTALKCMEADTGELYSLVEDKGVVGAWSFDKAQRKLAYLYGTMRDPGQIYIYTVGMNHSSRLTNMNEWLQTVNFGEMEEVWFKGKEGNDIQGWIIKPPGFDASKKYPSIMEIHGGPRTQYGCFFMHEFYYLAASGYVVYFCNPRGSAGYGEEHSKAIWNRWGTVDYEDLMAWADFVEKKTYIDPKRMGVTGGSYGGYMTNWIIGHTKRFAAAVTQRSVSNLISMYGSSDFNWVFEEELGHLPPWEAFENYWEQSPLKYIGNCTTPTLVIHNEKDLRADKEQGLQIYVALKRMGVETELVLFPDEPHGLSRHGRTDRRIERLNSIKGWFDRHLK